MRLFVFTPLTAKMVDRLNEEVSGAGVAALLEAGFDRATVWVYAHICGFALSLEHFGVFKR